MNKLNKKLYITALIVLIGSVLGPTSTQAQGNPANNNPLPSYTLLEPLPCIPGEGIECGTPGEVKDTINFKTYVQYTFNLIIALAAAAAVFMIVYGGLKYMSTDSWQGKNEGISKVKNALLGLLLVLTSYIILRTIDPRLVQIPTSLVPPLKINYQSATKNFFDQLAADAEKLQVDVVDLRAARDKSRILVNDREAYKEKLERDLVEAYKANDTDKVQEITLEIEGLNEEINDSKTDVILFTAKAGIKDILWTSSNQRVAQGDVSFVDGNIKLVQNKFEKEYGKLIGQRDKQIDLVDTKNYALGMLTLQKISIQAGTETRNILDGVWSAIPAAQKGAIAGIPGALISGYTGYQKGLENSIVKRTAERVDKEVIKVYANKIHDPVLADTLIKKANSTIAK